jgi:hypothetical protein
MAAHRMTKPPQKLNLSKIFRELQVQMLSHLHTTQATVTHSGTKGGATETQWLDMFRRYLPQRYCADRAFVLDCDGTLSDQIDVVIFDRQYSPFHFNQDGIFYVPAESVYAVFEVKPELNAGTIKYAGEKAASVRRLRRTSAPIPHAGGTYAPKAPPHIIAGILCTKGGWHPAFGGPFRAALQLTPEERLDLGCVLDAGSFYVNVDAKTDKIETNTKEVALVSFWLRFLELLQTAGTVAALDYSEYRRAL